ncbi:MAG: hypothetical protein H7235_10030, partial [Bdellovibrionaceae bacterium]|nr:hypothetical protein [Pseudobdellovibrionaceae bacterium]
MNNVLLRFILPIIHPCIFLVSVNSFSAQFSDQSTAKVRDFRYYREIIYKDANILIQKNTNPRRITVNKNNSSLQMIFNSKKSILEYNIRLQKTSHFVIYKSNITAKKIAYYS